MPAVSVTHWRWRTALPSGDAVPPEKTVIVPESPKKLDNVSSFLFKQNMTLKSSNSWNSQKKKTEYRVDNARFFRFH